MERDPVSLVADAVRVLHGNGAGTDRTMERARELAGALGIQVDVALGWSGAVVSSGDTVRTVKAVPDFIGMNRVAAVDDVIREVRSGGASLDSAHDRIESAAALPPLSVWWFAAASAWGAASLGIIFGGTDPVTLAIIALSAGVGAIVRRGVGRLGASVLWQAAIAALFAGLVASLTARLDSGADAMLLAVCPCMVLVPGPHLLNGLFDLARLRLPLGIAPVGFAALILAAIALGLMAGSRRAERSSP